MNTNKPFVRWEDLETVIFGNKAGSSRRSMPLFGEVTLKSGDFELKIAEYQRLICEAYKYFSTIHGQIPSSDDIKPDRSITAAEAKKICLMYAELLQSILLEKFESMSVDDQDQQFCQEIKVFEMFLSMSSFVIFGGCDKPQGLNSGLCYELAEWVKVRQPCGEQLRDNCLKAMPPNRSDSYWPAVFSLLTVGDLFGAVHLLRLHESSQVPDFAAAIELVEAFARLHADLAGLAEESDNAPGILSPGTNFRNNSLISALQNSWYSLTEAARVISEKMSSNRSSDWHAKLLTVAELLSGKESTYSDIKQYCDSWYHLLVPRLLYTDPFLACNVETAAAKAAAKQTDLTKHAKWCLGFYFGSTPALTPSDSLFYSLLTKDLGQLAKGIGENFSNWWLLAHLLDILYLCSSSLVHGGWITSGTTPSSASKQIAQPQLSTQHLAELRNFAVREYALSLSNDNDLWPIAASYLVDTSLDLTEPKSNCPNGADLASFLIRRAVLRFPSDETLNRALSLCNRLRLTDCYAELCVDEANKLFKIAKNLKTNDYELQGCKKEWLLVAAVSWAARPGDVISAREAADGIVSEILTSTSCKILSDPKSLPIWEALYSTAVGLLSSSTSISSSSLPYLNLVVRLYELHKAQPVEAVELLSNIVTSVIAAGLFSESENKAENLNGLLALELRSLLQNFVSARQLTKRLSDSFLLSMAKCVRDVSCLPQSQVSDNDLNKLLMIAIRQNTSSW